MRILLSAMVSGLLLSGCAMSPEPAAPNASAAAIGDLSGEWIFQVTTPRGVTNGRMQLSATSGGPAGTLTTDQGEEVLIVRSVACTGHALHFEVASPNGDVVFDGALAPDLQSFAGTVVYHTGQSFPMSGQRAQRQD